MTSTSRLRHAADPSENIAMVRATGPSGLVQDIPPPDLEAFLGTLRGPALRPGTKVYEEARVVFNAMHDQHPGLIVRCSGTADVVAALEFAADRKLLLATRAGGHSVASNSSCQGGLVIDLSGMTGIHVDPVGRTVRVQGGATWGGVDRETQLHGLAVPGGAVSTTGVAGLTLGGGIGWLRRKHGLSCDSLLSVEIVTADGQVRTASAKEHPRAGPHGRSSRRGARPRRRVDNALPPVREGRAARPPA
jgi:FAD/FMN-containing dehydrogenase